MASASSATLLRNCSLSAFAVLSNSLFRRLRSLWSPCFRAVSFCCMMSKAPSDNQGLRTGFLLPTTVSADFLMAEPLGLDIILVWRQRLDRTPWNPGQDPEIKDCPGKSRTDDHLRDQGCRWTASTDCGGMGTTQPACDWQCDQTVAQETVRLCRCRCGQFEHSLWLTFWLPQWTSFSFWFGSCVHLPTFIMTVIKK